MVFETSSRTERPRKGAMIVMIAVTLVILLVTIVFTVDVAFMQLTRTELRTAIDAAARAGAESLSRLQDETAAVDAAIAMAGQNRVAGKSFQLREENIIFGRVAINNFGTSVFTAGEDPPNALRVIAGRTAANADGPVDLFFGNILGRPDFEPIQSAVAAQLDRDISLVLDHSGSMLGVKFAGLTEAVKVFLAEIDKTPQIELVSLTGYSTTGAKLHDLTANTADIQTAFDVLSAGGRTAIGEGLQIGIDSLNNDPLRRAFAERTVILMTDGIHNEGIDPEDVIDQAPASNIIVHTITFGAGADIPRMQQLAADGNGQHFHAPDNAALIGIFKQIASTLPVVLTE